jgi:nucleoside-diphosphate kinase
MPISADTERTLAILKPDAVRRGLAGEIISRLERKGLRIVALKMIQIDRALAERHYGEHKGKSFYEPLLAFITSGPAIVMVLEGTQAIRSWRAIMGATNPLDASPGSIRGDYATETTFNLVHGSDAPKTAVKEIALFFAPEEIVSESSRYTH